MRIKILFLIVIVTFTIFPAFSAYQYNIRGNQGWLTFDSSTTLTFDLSVAGRTNGGKGNNNYIDRGGNFSDYGWYNLDTGSSGSFNNGVSATFSENDRIGLWVKDNAGDIYTTTKPDKNSADNIIWGKSKIVSGGFSLAGGNFGSNGTKEYYIFKINVEKNPAENTPSGQPLPGILATLVIGGGTLLYLKNRKKFTK